MVPTEKRDPADIEDAVKGRGKRKVSNEISLKPNSWTEPRSRCVGVRRVAIHDISRK